MVNNQEEEFTLADYWKVIWRRKWIVILTVVIVTASALLVSLFQTPIYETSTTLHLKKVRSSLAQMDIFGGTSPLSSQTEINTQIEIIKSYTMMEEVARRLPSLSIPRKADKKNLFYEYLKSLVGRIPFQPLHDWIRLISEKSNSSEQEKPKTLYEITNELRDSVLVTPIGNTQLVRLTASSDDPKVAQLIANTTAEVLIEKDISSQRRETSAALDFLSQESKRIEEELQQSEEALKEYKEKEGFSALSEKARLMVGRLSEIESQCENLKISRGEVSNRLKEVKSQIKKVSKTQISSTYISDNPIVQMLRSRLTDMEIKHAQLSREFSAEDPQTTYLKVQIEEIQKELQRQVGTVVRGKTESINPLYSELYTKLINYETEINILKARQNALESLLTEHEREVSKLPEQELELVRLERNQQVNTQLYIMLLQGKKQTEIESAGEIGSIEVIDRALKPIAPVGLNKKRNMLLGSIGGLILGVFFAFILEYADKTIKTEDEAKRLLNLSVLGVIPRPRAHGGYGYKYSYGHGKRKKRKEVKAIISQEKKIPIELITNKLPLSSISEAYRGLRTNLRFVGLEKKLKTIAVASSIPQEGKTSVTTNLGIALAEAKEKVLLIDADLRVPNLHKIFLLNESPGLTDILTTDRSHKDTIHNIDKLDNLHNLYVLTCGSSAPNPCELLASEKMKKLIWELREEYDQIVFDLPPILGISDVSALSSNVDGILLVLGANEVDREAVQKAKESLEKVKARILGLVLNKVEFEGRGYGSYYYYPYQPNKKDSK